MNRWQANYLFSLNMLVIKIHNNSLCSSLNFQKWALLTQFLWFAWPDHLWILRRRIFCLYLALWVICHLIVGGGTGGAATGWALGWNSWEIVVDFVQHSILLKDTWRKTVPLSCHYQIISECEDHNAAEEVDGGEDPHDDEGGHILCVVHAQLCSAK